MQQKIAEKISSIEGGTMLGIYLGNSLVNFTNKIVGMRYEMQKPIGVASSQNSIINDDALITWSTCKYKIFTMLKSVVDLNNAKGIWTSFLALANGREAIASKLIEVVVKS